ncbi:MAG TPA: cupin domain-containing protein [Firmicutes bacterium]|nr:cupin domain-containing protein [Bacillota bacterium]
MATAKPTDEKFIIRQLKDLAEARSTCGFRRALFTREDSDRISMSILRIDNSQKHWHNETHEIYYVLDGEGSLELDDDEVPLSPGVAVLVKPGVRHSAKGEVTVLIVGAPPFSQEDIFIEEK